MSTEHCGIGPASSPAQGACHCGAGSSTTLVAGARRIALAGAPNAGKTSIYNALTGLRAKTGNYPGVTVSRSLGACRIGEVDLTIEDLPGAYSLEPISPDEQIVRDVLTGDSRGVETPDALIVVVDATTLRRGMAFVAEALALGLPTCLAVTMTDELSRREGSLDVEALGRALGIPAVRVLGHRGIGIPQLREHLAQAAAWPRTPVPPPTDPGELASWTDSILAAADYTSPAPDQATGAIDRILLHPLWGTIVFFAIMYAFFQAIFTWAAPFQDAIEGGFGALAEAVHGWLDPTHPLLAGLLADGILGGVGSVLTFVPQIVIMFLIIALMEGVGYMSRAAFLMDRVMSRAGLEGRAFVALLSSFACAIPGIMATRTLPSAKDRLATMLAAPLMTCSARLPVYVIMISLLVDGDARIGPFGARGTIMFALYLLGAVSAMLAAWVVKRLTDRGSVLLPFYMEMPPYRLPRPRTVALMVWEACKGFLKKAGTIITLTTIILWVLLNVPMRSQAEFEAHCASDTQCAAVAAAVEDPAASAVVGEDGAVVTDPAELEALLAAQQTSYVMNRSWAAGLGRAVEPVFEPLGFEWRINVAILSSLAARETFVATLGQIAAAENPDEPGGRLASMTYQEDTLTNRAGDQLFNPATLAAILVFFVYALQCMATAGAMRRETGTWKWPLIAYGYMFVTAWVMAALVRTVVAALL
ncbi:ferrous iron transporter B [Actinomyces bowdenii]|uniref:Ferrous iron transporter B n=1 Tax=Actinomyces bowdenii TaxID=131109 RepID=A0A3P1V3Y6_9ACTO|nr:ferrous iron transporter B [Actinomyces bowdenii]MBO3725075.1 ferrous iron transporter B [Actinomyces bowdenii]RRD28902.1 ferrous iron transporter B [Actinomyces bowdenii]